MSGEGVAFPPYVGFDLPSKLVRDATARPPHRPAEEKGELKRRMAFKAGRVGLHAGVKHNTNRMVSASIFPVTSRP